MLALLAAAVLAASPAPRVAAPNWSVVNLGEKEGGFYVDYLARELGAHDVSVTTSSEMAALIGLERQKQLLGCSTDSTSCAAELAGALGVGSILVGSLAKFDSSYVLNLKLVAASDGRQLATYGERLSSNDALLDYLSRLAKDLAGVLRAGAEPHGVGARRPWWLIPAVAGAVSLGVGIVLDVAATSTANDLSQGDPSYLGRLDASLAAVSTNQTLGWALIGVGAAFAVAAVVMLLLGWP